MDKTVFDGATVNIDSDRVFIVLLLIGATWTTTVRQVHLYQARKRRHKKREHLKAHERLPVSGLS
jgi:hypothetical protein